MKTAVLLFCLLEMALTAAAVTATNTPLPTYIFTLQPGVNPDALAAELNLTPTRVYRHALNGFAAQVGATTVEGMKSDPRIAEIEADGSTQVFTDLTPINMPPTNVIGSGLIRMGITNFPEARINGVDERIAVNVAVLDTGVDLTSLKLSIAHDAGFIEGSDGDDLNGHGTWVAGIAAALDGGGGPVGVAAGANLWSVRVLGANGTGTWEAFLSGMDYLVQHANEIEVANASVGGIQSSNVPGAAIRQAVSNAVAHGVVFVAAAGNFKQDIYGTNGVFGSADTIYPAGVPEALTVSAMNQTSNLFEASYSDFSANVVTNHPVQSPGRGIDVCAPGNMVMSLFPFGGAAIGTGTSAAAPHVAGLAALYIAANGRATNAAGVYAIRQAIIDAGQPQSQWGVTNTLDPDGNPEPLAMPSLAWIPPVRLSVPPPIAQGFRLSFDTIPGYSYTLQYASTLTNPNGWSTLATTNGAGRLTNVTVIDPVTNSAARFYRVQRAVTP